MQKTLDFLNDHQCPVHLRTAIGEACRAPATIHTPFARVHTHTHTQEIDARALRPQPREAMTMGAGSAICSLS